MEYKSIEYWCACNKVTIASRYSGEFRSCPCGNCAVDQTESYVRFIGHILIPKETNNNNCM